MDTQAQSKLIQCNEIEKEVRPQKVSKFRRFLPQILAVTARNFITINTTLFAAFPSIVIASLTGLNSDLNVDETLHVTASQASYIAGLASIASPFGAFAGWIISDSIGRRKSLLIASVPLIFAWCVLAFARSLSTIYIAFIIMGIGLGLKEASSLAYTGEICETSIRGILLASAGLFGSCGSFALFFLGAFLSWRKVALICVAVPVFVLITMIFVPETPIWLISKHKTDKALSSLQWLRGCVTADTVIDEYKNLQQYSERSRACNSCGKQSKRCDHTESILNKLKQLKRKRIMKPLILAITLQFFLQFSAIMTWRPYIIQILNAYAIRWNVSYAAVVLSSMGLVAKVCSLSLIKTMGKRKLYLVASAVTYLSCFGLSAIGFLSFPVGWSSFQLHRANETESNATLTHVQQSIGNYSHFILALILIIQFAESVGLTNVTFVLLAEIFPFKFRAMLLSIIAGFRYIFVAFSTKLYYNVESWLSIPGAAAFYGIITLFGFIVMYIILPETEGRSLEDIELHYSDNSKGLANIHIPKKRNRVNEIS